jgi:hypothetical protein
MIARRLAAWPFYQLARCLLTVSALVGWGWQDARRVWVDTA